MMSAKRLLIVESPAKAKTIGKMLGGDFEVRASMGHVRDLPERTLGVDVQNRFEPEYVALKDRAKVLKELKTAARGKEAIYLAPDPDREGEAIAWHLREYLKDVAPEDRFLRVTYNEITATAVRRAVEHPGPINMNLVNAQQARRVLDRLVGYKVSPLLQRRVRGSRSAGRVQTAALRIVVEREQAIRAFQPQEYWILGARVAKQKEPRAPFDVRLARIGDEKAEIHSKERAEEVRADLETRSMRVRGETRREISRRAPPPFITSSLQQAGSRALGFVPSRTMRLAQSLYEGVDLGGGPEGLITYMRTDSFNVAVEAREAARAFIRSAYGDAYAPEKPNFYKTKAGAQEAHECIRPTDVRRTPDALAHVLNPDELKLYRLIWQRFVASQMSAARIAQRTVEVDAEPGPATASGAPAYLFRATASEVLFPGYQKVSGDDRPRKTAVPEDSGEAGAEEEADSLPPVEPGEPLDRLDWIADQKFTEPPPRYSDATLVKAMEENGIGRPSTYAATVQTLQDRAYVERVKRTLVPTPLGEQVCGYLVSHLASLFDIQFTARMEEELDEVEEGSQEWHEMLEKFYVQLTAALAAARQPLDTEGLDKVRRLTDLLGRVSQWKEPVKRGRRTYDDHKFVLSVRDQLEAAEKPLTQRQLDALRSLGARYADQVEDLKAEAEALGLPAITQATGGDPKPGLARLELLREVTFGEPRTVRGRVYDDAKFVQSLREQAESGRALTERQLAALDRILSKYAAVIPDYERRVSEAGITAVSSEPVAQADPERCRELLGALDAVKEWKPPVKRGRRMWSDEAFFVSLRKQFGTKGSLSIKQLASLEKMAKRYSALSEDA
ncbi:MAG: type I DNA topoisomerase, partial [Kiritimatiellae bacterium]|nr:type I DNA topoisomerase [Kiritimatiellia bacterium]